MKLLQEKILNGQWELRDEDLDCDLSQAHDLGKSTDGWIAQPVPGDIHQGLIAAAKIKEPLVGLNFFDCSWTETRSWWFRKSFEIASGWLDADAIELEMDGLDSNAEVFLNGEHVASHRNTFRPLVVDIKGVLKPGDNVLLVRLTTGVEDVTDDDVQSTDGVVASTQAKYGYPHRGDERRVFVRKPQYSFGWDWCPRLATTAIAGDVKLRAISKACIRDVNLRPIRHGDNQVLVDVGLIVDCLHYYKTCKGTVCATLSDPQGRQFAREHTHLLRSGCNFIRLRIPISAPKLWWPNGLGEQNLYRVEVCLEVGEDKTDYPAFDYGLRFVELSTDDEFAVVVNGKKVFCKGANWIPADAIYARVSDDRYEQLVRQARDANFNMLRVWGGGWYERDAFYQACDRYGIMVWQDFMFACGPYPDRLEWFRAEVEKEADYQTKRLSRHACLMLWCGSNENNWGFRDWWNEKTRAGAYLYNYLLPSIVQRNCPQIPYWNGSPYGGDAPNSEAVGDHHRWHECMMHPEMEKRITPEEYDKCDSLFVSEFGYVGACGKETTVTYLDGACLDHGSELWRQHTNVFEKDTVAAGIRKHYADPDKLGADEYLLYSGLCQGLMYQYALESMRYRDNCHGGLFWMFNDCWGEVGWTIIDYYMRRKISWYFVRRAFEPVRLIMRSRADKIRVVAANDTPSSVSLKLEYGYLTLDGECGELENCTVDVPPLSRTQCCIFPKGRNDPTAGLWIARAVGNSDIQPAVFRTADYRNLKTTPPELSLSLTGGDKNSCVASVATDSYAHAVHFVLPEGTTPEDDYFDLLPGQSKKVRIFNCRRADADAIAVGCVNELQKR